MDDLLQKWIDMLVKALEIIEDWNEGRRDTIGEAFEIISDVVDDMGKTREAIIRDQEQDIDPMFDPLTIPRPWEV